MHLTHNLPKTFREREPHRTASIRSDKNPVKLTGFRSWSASINTDSECFSASETSRASKNHTNSSTTRDVTEIRTTAALSRNDKNSFKHFLDQRRQANQHQILYIVASRTLHPFYKIKTRSSADADKPARRHNRVGRYAAELLCILYFQNGGRPPSWFGMTS